MPNPALAYIALAVDDADASASFFEQAFGLHRAEASFERENVPLISIGETALAFFNHGSAALGDSSRKGVHHIAIASDAPQLDADASGLAGPATGHATAGLDGRTQARLLCDATCGVDVRFTQPLELPRSASPLVERLDHLGIASSDNARARHVFVDTLQCPYESEQVDSEWETRGHNIVSEQALPGFAAYPMQLRGSLRVTFITAGDCELEFLQDISVSVSADAARHDAAGNTRGDRSAIARYIERYGAGLHHLAFKTDDIDAALATLADNGYRLIDRNGRPGSRRSLIGFVHPTTTQGVLMHLVQREEL
ncbi:MAG: VOC family protein [Pseudomonadota bacterium]